MKKEDLFEALGDIDEKEVKDAGEYRVRKKPAWIRYAVPALCMALLLGIILRLPFPGSSPAGQESKDIVTVRAEYPSAAAESMDAEAFIFSEEHKNWRQEYLEKVSASEGLKDEMRGYYASLMEKILARGDENTVCSPLNTYIAFSMLAEVTAGNTQRQILDVLGVQDIETLRSNITALWNSNYADTPLLKSLLANSVWLKDSVSYDRDTLDLLARDYYASSFSGVPGSEEMDRLLQEWTDENTGNLLSEYTKDLRLDPETVLAIVSTVLYRGMWADVFYTSATEKRIFHGTKGDTEADMMHRYDSMNVYRGDSFTAVGLRLTDSGMMYFLLPDEGTDVRSLVSDPDVLNVTDNTDEHWSAAGVDLFLPKFKVSSKTDLMDIMAEMGMTDVLDPSKADFTPLSGELEGISVSEAEHAAMVEIDEKGVTGAAYTDLAATENAVEISENINFILDRPFMFLLTGADGSMLFTGIVRNIE